METIRNFKTNKIYKKNKGEIMKRNSMEIYPYLEEEINESNETQKEIDEISWEDYSD